MLTSGVLGVGFSMAIVAGRHATPANAVAAVLLSTTYLYLVVVFVVEGGLSGDVLVRDIGLVRLAQAVFIDPLQQPIRTP